MTQKPTFALNRRAFLARLGAAGLILTGSGIRQAAMAAEGNTLVWARPAETTLYDPHTAGLGNAWQLMHLIYETLVTLDDDLNVVPALASAWEWEDNALVFTIRSGVKFANGRDMTLDDVVRSIQRAMTAPGNPWPLLLRNLSGVSARGDSQVVMAFDGPNAIALDAMTATLMAILPMAELDAGTFSTENDMMMGTGPFSVESHVVNDQWVLRRNPNYWQADMPKVDSLIVRNVPSAQGLVAALRDGSADIASFEANPDAPALIAGIADVTHVTQRQTAYHFVALNAVREGGLFTDLRVRQAVALAIDRQQIVDFVYAGASTPTYGFTQFGVGDDSALPLVGPDLDRARALVREAGAEGRSFNLLYANTDVTSAMAQLLAQQLAAIGLNAELEGAEPGVWLGRTWGSNPSDLDMTVTYYAGFGNPLITAHWWAPELAGFTAGHVAADPAYTEALNTAIFSSGEAAVAALQALYVRLNENANKIPLCVRSETVAWRTDRADMAPSVFQTQEDILAGVEAFARKT